MNYLDNLNTNQRTAVTAELGPVIVIAGAGSGKTKVLTSRIAYLIDEKNILGREILAITFTNKAANEMKTRLFNVFEADCGSTICTYHSLCLKILKEDIGKLNRVGNFIILDEEDQLTLLKNLYADNNIDPKIFKPQKLQFLISNFKCYNFTSENLEKITSPANLTKFGSFRLDEFNVIRKLYKLYQNKLLEMNSVDFDDLLLLARKILIEHPDCKEK
jgi:DNA helicase-2/ATP-dependent DNA helicase PcrA